MQTTNYNIAITFDEVFVSQYHTLLQQAKLQLTAEDFTYIDSIPHITVFPVSIPDQRLTEIKQLLDSRGEIQVKFDGLSILPSSHGGYWFEILCLSSKALRKIQTDLIDFGLSSLGRLGDEYRPHCTLFHTRKFPTNVLELLHTETLRQTVSGKISLCKPGQYGEVTEIL